jgi:oligopeptide/dipeptide ABC transporter ATP-binding protein
MLLDFRSTNIHFNTKKGDVHVIRELAYQVERGKTLGIVGESGCGKSVSSLAIMGLLPESANVDSEGVFFNGQDLLGIGETDLRKIRGQEIGMIFQDPMSSLNPCMKVGEQITEVLNQHTSKSPREIRKEVIHLLDRVGIPDPEKRFSNYPHELSGGMCQRVMIAMAIALKPKLLIADEPTTALDVTIQAQILRLLKQLQQDENMGMILISHDMGVIKYMSDSMLVMYAGECVEYGETQDVIDQAMHPYTRKLLASLPDFQGERKRRLETIQGIVPDLARRPLGCQFYERCSLKENRCLQTIAMKKTKGGGIRCVYGEQMQGTEHE